MARSNTNDLRINYSLTKMPFSNALKPKDLYVRPCMDEIAAKMEFCINSGYFYTVIGDVGAGKSTALSYAISKLPGKKWEPVMVMGFNSSFTELIRQLLITMNINIKSGQQSRLLKMVADGFASYAESGKTPVIVIDEAHLFATDVFQQIHIISQQVPRGSAPVPIVLCGQELLVEKMTGPFCKPLMSRVMDGSVISGMSQSECLEYVNHHLRTICGASNDIFEDKAVIAVSQASAGIPRRINEICLKAMGIAMDNGRESVCVEDVRKASCNWWNR